MTNKRFCDPSIVRQSGMAVGTWPGVVAAGDVATAVAALSTFVVVAGGVWDSNCFGFVYKCSDRWPNQGIRSVNASRTLGLCLR